MVFGKYGPLVLDRNGAICFCAIAMLESAIIFNAMQLLHWTMIHTHIFSMMSSKMTVSLGPTIEQNWWIYVLNIEKGEIILSFIKHLLLKFHFIFTYIHPIWFSGCNALSMILETQNQRKMEWEGKNWVFLLCHCHENIHSSWCSYKWLL